MGMIFGKIDVECAAHDVLLAGSQANFAVRRYKPHVIARVRGSSARDNGMFRLLATYIGVYGTPMNRGMNSTSSQPQQIAMTAPVISSVPKQIAMTAPVVSTSENHMAFVLPKEYTSKDMAPKPTDPRVELHDVPERLLAVKTFSGNHDYDSAKTIAIEFQKEIENFGLTCKTRGEWQLARYNPPFTLWWLRTNEIWIDIEESEMLHKNVVEKVSSES